jgi:hypothetical protein
MTSRKFILFIVFALGICPLYAMDKTVKTNITTQVSDFSEKVDEIIMTFHKEEECIQYAAGMMFNNVINEQVLYPHIVSGIHLRKLLGVQKVEYRDPKQLIVTLKQELPAGYVNLVLARIQQK